jgi:hypothetical protein
MSARYSGSDNPFWTAEWELAELAAYADQAGIPRDDYRSLARSLIRERAVASVSKRRRLRRRGRPRYWTPERRWALMFTVKDLRLRTDEDALRTLAKLRAFNGATDVSLGARLTEARRWARMEAGRRWIAAHEGRLSGKT